MISIKFRIEKVLTIEYTDFTFGLNNFNQGKGCGVKTYAYGFPRLGENREFKKIVESFWKGDITETECRRGLDRLQTGMLASYQENVDHFPVGEMTGYDQMLDTAIMVGLYKPKNLKGYYALCRGKDALEMTKWFNTNYHYLVPDFSSLTFDGFSLNWNKAKEYLAKFKKGIPALIGPFTFLKLSKGIEPDQFRDHLLNLAQCYKEILDTLGEVHIEEPAFVMDLSAAEIEAIRQAYDILAGSACKKYLFTYYGSVDFFKEFCRLPVYALGLDFVHGDDNLKALKANGFPEDKVLIAGLVDGRNIWRTDLKKAVGLLKEITRHVKSIMISNAAPLYHLPISLEGEDGLDMRLKQRLAFAREKLEDLKILAELLEKGKAIPSLSTEMLWHNPKVQERLKGLTDGDFHKKVNAAKRRKLQDKILNLPLFPTTTIGSYPQTSDVRKQRADFRSGRISAQEYNAFVREKITDLVSFQEKIGLDVLVHGEFERTDMVEFFAEKLDGIATTQNGWIISYGTRGYRPPIIYGDVSRPKPMTLDEITFAQGLTSRPVKGMLTGAVTIIAWSFVREDIPLSAVAYQIALALKDEILDYERAGIKIVQVDEPAIREKAPIKKKDWGSYFDWAVKSFRLSTNTDPNTQIHTHMCYSEFGEIVDKIDQMDFDVISVEATRSKGDIIASFEKIDFDKQIGLGVWDIHSPAVPSVADMRRIVERVLRVIPKENFWINPDCGLKTRDWEETKTSLNHLVTLSRELRAA